MVAMRLTLLTAACLSILAAPAWAQESQQRACAPLDKAEAYLAAEFRETRVGQGVIASGRAMLMLYASADGATWTLLMVSPDKIACQVADGADWQVRVPEADQGEGL